MDKNDGEVFQEYRGYRLGLPKKFSNDIPRLAISIDSKIVELEAENKRHTMRERLTLKRQRAYLHEIQETEPSVGIGVHMTHQGGHMDGKRDSDSRELHYLPHLRGRVAAETFPDTMERMVKPATEKRTTMVERIKNIDTCPNCNLQMKVSTIKGIMVCDRCGLSETYMDVTINALPYRNNVEVTNFSYKRINHFNDWLLQIQGKEGVSVPDDVCKQVITILSKERITDMEKVTNQKVREILKSLKLNKMYEHVTQITCKVTGRTPPQLSPEMEAKCRLMFIAIQSPFETHCPPERKNFLSYPYCLFKFLELLGYTEFLNSFILLKGRDKLYKQDVIFQKICETLDWEFIPSV